MPLSLILHDLSALAPDDEKRFFESIFQIAPEHWQVSKGATLAETGVSPAYLRDHLLRTLPAPARVGTQLLVTHVSADAAWNALPVAGEQWVRDALAP
ncbi:hypothetical protein E2C06_06015 [Dankookia rubra]|uniref:Uncharacterized protein n=1 Tax=Dankookia rubra TaxID=1442381 RepID=A0A4R5QJ09_9PROT|nr:hypothetical protein [Dankookia rubra]TDH63390.1 hypothetical protein E2C06_06015 [Dankookia rubra]